MTMRPRVLVMMTTFNGQAYVAAQIDSILAQQEVDVTLRIADDCSTDGTYRILETYAAEHGNVHISLNSQNMGCSANFMQLIFEADPLAYDFFAISDQDDVWRPAKLCVATRHIQANTSRPELYYAGVNNVDVGGEPLGNEYAQYRRIVDKPLSLLLVQNWALGCTMLFNGALLKLLQSCRTTDFGRVYDAWIHAVCLYAGGRTYCDIERCYIDRRITGNNVMGLMNQRRNAGFIVKQAFQWFVHRDDERAAKHTKMAQCLEEGYADRMDPEVADIVGAVAHRETSFSSRWKLFRCRGIAMPTRARTAWLKLMVLFNRF